MKFQNVRIKRKEVLDETENLIDKLSEAEKEYLIAEAVWKNEEDKQYLKLKTENEKATDSWLKASSRDWAHNKRINCIIKESKYQRLKREYALLDKKFQTIQEESYFAREEINKLGMD